MRLQLNIVKERNAEMRKTAKAPEAIENGLLTF